MHYCVAGRWDLETDNEVEGEVYSQRTPTCVRRTVEEKVCVAQRHFSVIPQICLCSADNKIAHSVL